MSTVGVIASRQRIQSSHPYNIVRVAPVKSFVPQRECIVVEIEAILRESRPAVREMVDALCTVVQATVPEATEAAYLRWRGIGYRHPMAGYFCGIFPQTDHVRLLFEFGILLSDPQGLLQGDGKQTRYLIIRDAQAIPVAIIQHLIGEALALPYSRQAKLALIAERNAPP